MFELSIACKYLLPRWRQLSVSIISLISIVVISLVVWLVLVFFSVTTGLEKIWVEKLIAVTAPIRVVPTDDYYKSYYYQVDALSSASDYNLKSLAEKLQSESTDPYNPLIDEEIPANLPAKDVYPDGSLKDIVKLAVDTIQSQKGFGELTVNDYQMTFANIRLRMLRGVNAASPANQAFVNHSIYLGSFDSLNPHFGATILPLTPADLINSYSMLAIGDNIQEDNPSDVLFLNREHSLKKNASFLKNLDTDAALANLPAHELAALAAAANQKIQSEPVDDLAWVYRLRNDNGIEYKLPSDPLAGDGVIIPKNFKEAGVLVGDRGYLSYYAPTTSSIQEQRLPIFVAGFYDPGIVPLGGKFVLAAPELVSTIRNSHNQEDTTFGNGFNVRINDLSKVDSLKRELKEAFSQAGIGKYWKIETYKDFEFARDLLQQLNSEKNIFSLIAAVIIIVACSNIISMMVILVNDKRTEIGILRSMGATSFSIAAIFGFSGMIMGLLGSIIGTFIAIFTLKNIEFLIDMITKLQGFQAFNPLYYGNTLPHEISKEAFFFVITATVITSLLAGLIPAIKACSLKPAAILRS